MLVRCLYASRPAGQTNGLLLDQILDQSRKNNPQLGVTGLLCVTDKLFIQLIEGGRDEVCDLFNAIVRDDRHEHVRILIFEEIMERQFANWSMGHADISKLNPTMLLKYFKRAEIDPFESSGASTLRLLTDLVSAGAIVRRGE